MSEHSSPVGTSVDICGEALGAPTSLRRSSLTDCIWCSTCRRELSKPVRESFWIGTKFVELSRRCSLVYVLYSVAVFGQAQDLLSCREL